MNKAQKSALIPLSNEGDGIKAMVFVAQIIFCVFLLIMAFEYWGKDLYMLYFLQ